MIEGIVKETYMFFSEFISNTETILPSHCEEL